MHHANPQAKPQVSLTGSRQLTSWLAEQRVSFAFTTYQAGKLFFLGLYPDGRLSIAERTFNRCMGLAAADDGLWMSTLFQLWRFENTLEAAQDYQGFDKLYVPRYAYTTGDIDAHDIVVAGTDRTGGQVIFVNTLFSCLAGYSPKHSFTPLWQPPFISRLAAEDRCHLNGLALRDGRPATITSVSVSDVADGWRDVRRDGGIVMDIPSGRILCRGLSMPHSPRWYRDRLYVLDSGNGWFGRVDVDRERFEPIAFCPGYLRGLDFVGDFAVVGLSRPRHDGTFSGLNLDDELARRNATARCGLQIIDLNTGDSVHQLRIEGFVEELYDVVALPGVRQPHALGFQSDEIRRVLTMGPMGELPR